MNRFEKALKRSREGWFGRVARIFDRATVGDELWDELEELLITADVGMGTTARLLDRVKKRVASEGLKDGSELRSVLKEEMVAMLTVENSSSVRPEPVEGRAAKPFVVSQSNHVRYECTTTATDTVVSARPLVLMVVGVNGTGKTLSIAKLAHSFKEQGLKVILAAADTFRAAAVDQLKILGQRVEAEVIAHQSGADPGAVVFDSMEAAWARRADVVIIDTAGRLHTKFNLMEELKKIKRVASRKDPQAPHEVLLVLDATTGQNGLTQAKYFTDAVGVTGVFLTKLDGTAKGGIVLAICDQLRIPIRFVGTGEGIEDMAPFDAQAFIEALSS